MEKHLHIISLNVPYPVQHGGMIDLFYKIIALHDAGIKIHLHCFSKHGETSTALDKWCEEVYYYPRKKGIAAFSFKLPYIVSSRMNNDLHNRLLRDDHPILLEGIHCTGILLDNRFEKRKTILRLHNIESVYYRQLGRSTTALFKKTYFLFESILLKHYEKRFAGKASLIVPVSENDSRVFQQITEQAKICYLPVFTGFGQVRSLAGTGEYCLYHGNLSVPENERAVMWLLKSVFKDLEVPLVIAGRHPSASLVKLVNKNKRVTLISNPSHEELEKLIAGAQCHVLPSFNSTGVKLKLIHALFNGRHCIVNPSSVDGSQLTELCIVAGDADTFKRSVIKFNKTPFTSEDIRNRQAILEDLYNIQKNAQQLIQWIW